MEKRKKHKSGNSDGDSGGSGGKKKKSKLQLTDGMKQPLVSQGNMSEDEATSLWSSVMKAQGDGIPYWYYFIYPFLCCIRLAQPCVSFINFIFQFLFGFQVDNNYWIYWKLVSFILEIIFELSCWFKWLIWIAIFHFGYYLARILVLPLVIFYSIFGYAKFYNKKGHEPSSRRSKRIFF